MVKRIISILRSPITMWVAVYGVISSPILAALVVFIGIAGLIFASWVAYFLWSVVFYRLLSNKEAIERAREKLKDEESRGWFWRLARFIRTRAGTLLVYFFFLTLGPVFAVPVVKVSGKGNLRGDLLTLLIGSLLSAPPLILLGLGLATFTPISGWILELVRKILSIG